MGITSIITCIDSLTTSNSTSYHKLEEKLKYYKYKIAAECSLG